MLAAVVFALLSESLIAFVLLWRSQVFPSLAITGLLYNLAMLADKFIFWFNPQTSVGICGNSCQDRLFMIFQYF